jgi:hypothetical protein
MRSAAFLAFLLASTSTPALALDFGNGFSLTGEVEFEYADISGSDSETYFIGDVTLGWRAGEAGALGFGFDFAVDTAYLFSESEDFTAYWGGLVLTTGFGEFTVGAARPVLDTVYQFPDVGTNGLIGVELGFVNGSIMAFYPKIADRVATGVSLAGSSGAFGYGVSVHKLDAGGATLDGSQIALTYSLGDTMLMGGVEAVSVSGGNNLSTVQFGVVYDKGPLELGVELKHIDNGPSTTRLSRLHAGYDVTDAITVSGDIARISGSGSGTDIWGLGAEYRFGNGGFLEVGTTSIENTDIWDLGLGFRF